MVRSRPLFLSSADVMASGNALGRSQFGQYRIDGKGRGAQHSKGEKHVTARMLYVHLLNLNCHTLKVRKIVQDYALCLRHLHQLGIVHW